LSLLIFAAKIQRVAESLVSIPQLFVRIPQKRWYKRKNPDFIGIFTIYRNENL